MKTPKTSKLKHGASIESLVIGGGLSGLFLSALLLKKGRNVTLVEKLPKIGGRFSPELRDGFLLGSGFAFGDSSPWRALCDRLGIDSGTIPVTEGKALLLGTKGWTEPDDFPLWESHISTNCSEFPAGGIYGMVNKLLEFCESYENFSLNLEAPATALTIENGKIARVNLGAEVEIGVSDVFWTSEYKGLLEAVRGEGVPEPGPERVSWLKKFVKTESQPGVALEFAHKKSFADFTETLLLPFPSGDKDDRRFLVGSISSNRDPGLAPEGKALSSWIMPLSELEWSDNHESMKKIRSARRLLEKAFPSFESNIDFDRVLVLDSTFGPSAKKKGEWKPLLENLSLCGDWAMPSGATLDGIVSTMLEKWG